MSVVLLSLRRRFISSGGRSSNILKVDHLYLPAVFGHKDENITIVWIMMRHLFDNLEQAAIATAHICHSWDIVETLQTGYRQHRPSSFSTNFKRLS